MDKSSAIKVGVVSFLVGVAFAAAAFIVYTANALTTKSVMMRALLP